MRSIVSAVIACVLFASSAFADSVPLSPGKPAGVHKAQFYEGNGIYILAGAALIGVGIALAVSSGNGASPTVATTSATTSTSGTSP
jgi:hypothetical protein